MKKGKKAKLPKSTKDSSGCNSGSLLTISYPPGFDDDGRRVLAECPEFKLIEMFKEGGQQILETSPEIEEAEWAAVFRIKGLANGDWGEPARQRIRFAIAIQRLIQFKKMGGMDGCLAVARRFADALVPEIERVYSSKSPATIAESIGGKIKDAILANLRNDGLIKDNRTTHVPAVAVLIWEAKGQFMHTRRRPQKSDLRKRLEMIGCGIKGKDAAARWRERFMKAALGNLPE